MRTKIRSHLFKPFWWAWSWAWPVAGWSIYGSRNMQNVPEPPIYYTSNLVNTKTTIPLRVGEQRQIYTSTPRVSVYNHYYSPPLRGIVKLRAVSYFSLQSYCTRNLSTLAAKPRAARNEGVSTRRKNKRLLTLLFCLGTTKLSR